MTSATRNTNQREKRVRIDASQTATTSPTASSLSTSPAVQARAHVIASLVSLPQAAKDFVLLHHSGFLKTYKEMEKLKSTYSRFDDTSYVPRSAQLKFDLNFSDSAKVHCQSSCESAKTDRDIALDTARTALTKVVRHTVEIEMRAKQFELSTHYLEAINELAQVYCMLEGLYSRASDKNDVHHRICVKLIESDLSRPPTTGIEDLNQSVFDRLKAITGHRLHQLNSSSTTTTTTTAAAPAPPPAAARAPAPSDVVTSPSPAPRRLAFSTASE